MDVIFLVTAVTFGMGAMASAVLSWANRQHLIVIHNSVNGRLDELLTLTALVAEAKGLRMGREEKGNDND
jgi:hypothetical protein